jgi:hypothetical protein
MKPVSQIEDPKVAALAGQAEQFLAGFRWCRRILEADLAWAAAELLGVFRVRIDPAREDIDEVVWVVVGDLPPAYLAYDPRDTWQDALRGYVDEMHRWVEAANSGKSVSNLIHVNLPPTSENAERLESRLVFIRTHLVDVPEASLESDA